MPIVRKCIYTLLIATLCYSGPIGALLLFGKTGNIHSQVILGSMFYRGYAVPKNIETARYWYQLAVDQNNSHAKYSLASLYFNGEGVPQDNIKALTLFRESTDEGVGLAQAFLGRLL